MAMPSPARGPALPSSGDVLPLAMGLPPAEGCRHPVLAMLPVGCPLLEWPSAADLLE